MTPINLYVSELQFRQELQAILDTVPTGSAFNELVDDRVASLLVAGSNVTLTYNDVAGTLTIASSGGGGGGGNSYFPSGF